MKRQREARANRNLVEQDRTVALGVVGRTANAACHVRTASERPEMVALRDSSRNAGIARLNVDVSVEHDRLWHAPIDIANVRRRLADRRLENGLDLGTRELARV